MIVDYLSIVALDIRKLDHHLSDFCRKAEVSVIAPRALWPMAHDLFTSLAVHTL